MARTAVYARNLAATRGLRELPSLAELLLSAKATIGDGYAARVYRLAMRDTVTDATRALPALTWEVAPNARRAGYRLNGRWLATEAWLRADRAALAIPEFSELDRAARDGHYKDLPRPHSGDRFFWGAYPPDEAAYEEFVRYLLRRASVSDEDAGRSAPFTCGMRDGVDVRATIRHWQDDTLYVREARRGAMRFTNGVIDWTSSTERSPVLWSLGANDRGGWNDPDSPHVGSCSREVQPLRCVVLAWPERGHAPASRVVGAHTGLPHLSRSSRGAPDVLGRGHQGPAVGGGNIRRQPLLVVRDDVPLLRRQAARLLQPLRPGPPPLRHRPREPRPAGLVAA